MATYRGLTIQSGVYKQIQDANTLGVGGGIAAQTAAQTLTITAGAGANIVANSLFDPSQGIDRSSATTMYIGATNATTIYIGRTGQTTQIVGDLNIQGAETIVGTSTFQNNATFEGNVTIGASLGPDTLDFAAGFGFLGSATNPNVYFLKENNHTLAVDDSTASNVAGGDLIVSSGAAGAGNAAGGVMSVKAGNGFGTGNGGAVKLSGGDSGAGATGNGGAVTIGAGDATSTNGNGGAVTIDGGQKTGTGTAGIVYVGGTYAEAVEVGRTGKTTTVMGDLSVNGNTTLGDASTDTISFTGVLNTNIIFQKEANYNIQVQTSTTANANGGNVTVQAGAADGNGNGGTVFIAGGSAPGNGPGGFIVIDGGTSVGGNPGVVSIGPTDASGVTLGHAGITTSITGDLSQQTGSFGLQGNAASSLSTTAGALTIDGFAGVVLKGGITLAGAGTALIINAAGTAVTVQSGATLTTTGTGNINLPNNGSARFKIESTSVGSTVTAPNLDTLTNGSNADALHTHSGVSASSVAITKTADENLSAGNLLALGFNGGTPICNKADANGSGTRPNAVGFTAAAVTASNPATIVVSGEVAVADASWDSVPTTSDVGAPVYMSETAGNVTLTAPSTSGSTVQKVGIVSVGGSGAVKVLVQIGDGVVLA